MAAAAAAAAAAATSSCPCEGLFDASRRHYIWVAFLHIDNGQYAAERWGTDYRLVPMNRATTWLSGSPWIHCQTLFWNQQQLSFITFSVDSRSDRVHYESYKQFARGWYFYRVEVSAAQERRMYDFLADQCKRRAPFNRLGALLVYVCPVDRGGGGDAGPWFCSQLVVATFQAADLFTDVEAYAMGPAEVAHYLATNTTLRVAESANPRLMKALDGHEHAFD